MTAINRQSPLAGETRRRLEAGTAIEVWSRSVGRWVGGFEVVDWAGDRCWIQRSGNPGEGVLPELFRAADVRRNIAREPGTIGRHL